MSDPYKSRRDFLKEVTTLTVGMVVGSDFVTLASKGLIRGQGQMDEVPWYRELTRWGQTNITELDVNRYDINWWREYWKRTQTQAVIINAGGIVSYYPSQVQLHRQARFLNGRDLFGELSQAAHEEGLAVMARIDSNRAHEEFYQTHPDWFAIDSEGDPYKAGDLYLACVNSPYYDEHIPAILREIAELYEPEGFTDNRWHGLDRHSICYCKNCRKSFYDRSGKEIPSEKNWDDQTYREWIEWNYDRRLEIWELNNRTTKKAGGPHCIWSGMVSSSISEMSSSFRDYKEICSRADIAMLDYQSRRYGNGLQHNAEMGKLVHSMLGWDKLIPESMAIYLNHGWDPVFRLASKSKPEVRLWMQSGMAGGIQPWWHHVSAYHEDRRMYSTVEPIYRWHKANEKYLINREPIASVGIVWSQQNMDFYGRDDEELVEEPWRGMTQALFRARIPYLPVHADHIERDAEQFSVLVLPNIGVMTDEQIASVRRFVEDGGSLVATGQSSLFNQWGDPRPDYALGDLFGAHVMEEFNTHDEAIHFTDETSHTYLRLTPELRRQVDGPQTGEEPMISGERHAVLQGFEETDILPFGGELEAIRTDPGAKVLMTYIPEFPTYPPETAWMRESKTNIPGLILNTISGGSRVAFMPADIDRQFSRNNLPDHSRLLANLIRWADKDNIPLEVEGSGLIDCQLYHQPGRMILHIINLSNEGTWREPVSDLVSIGPLHVRVKLPYDVQDNNLRLLVSKSEISTSVEDGWCSFEVKSVLDHEVVVIS